jgi:hypothetical protein
VTSINSGVVTLDLWDGRLAVAGEDGRLWRADGGGDLWPFEHSSAEVLFLRLLADGSVFLGTRGGCRIFPAPGWTGRAASDASAFAISADRRLVAWGEEDGAVGLLDVPARDVAMARIHRDRVTALAFLDRDLVSASQDGTVCLARRYELPDCDPLLGRDQAAAGAGGGASCPEPRPEGRLRRASAARAPCAVTALAAAAPHVLIGLSTGEVLALRTRGS